VSVVKEFSRRELFKRSCRARLSKLSTENTCVLEVFPPPSSSTKFSVSLCSGICKYYSSSCEITSGLIDSLEGKGLLGREVLGRY
jgi:hypothetical protein